MSLEQFANVGDIIAAVGVIGSLIYLAIQVQQNTQSIRTSAAESASTAVADVTMKLALSPDTLKILLAGGRDYGSMSEEHQVRFHFACMAAFNVHEMLFFRHQRNQVEPEFWLSRVRRMASLCAMPGMNEWWQRNRDMFTDSFREFVEQDVLRKRNEIAKQVVE